MSRAARWTTMLVLLALPLAAAEPAVAPLHVMVTNDDGVDAPGIAALAAALAADPSYRVTVVAPAQQQSGKGHAIATRGPIALAPHARVGGAAAWSVGATPATTARMGLATVLADDPPALVVSGINRGENDGILAWYSGTVGAAREAMIAGFPAIAFSLELDWADPRPDWAGAARWAKAVVDAAVRQGLPAGAVLNVNIPHDVAGIRGVRLARMSVERSSVENFHLERRDEDGTCWYEPEWEPAADAPADTDVALMNAGWVVVAPLGLDQTAWAAFPQLSHLDEAAPAPAPPVPAAAPAP